MFPSLACLRRWTPLLLALAPFLSGPVRAQGVPAADTVYVNGAVYTADRRASVRQALAVRGGLIVYAGTAEGAQAYIGPTTARVDLGGRMLMPGLVDGHMHPLAGGAALLGCDLKYERLTVAQMQQRIQACLDGSREHEPDGWLVVQNWFQEAMIGGTATSRATLDALTTHRPILMRSSFGHTALVNSRALELSQINARTADPPGGKIMREASGSPSGLLEDDATALAARAIPTPTAAENVKAAQAALQALAAQGITSFLDAAAGSESLAAFAALDKAGQLTARAHFAVLIKPAEAGDVTTAVARAHALAAEYDSGPLQPTPHLTVRNIKLFLDGVITAPAMTGAMLAPYRVNIGTRDAARWVAGKNRGPEVYFPAPVLRELVLAAAAAGLEPHMHADGDRAVHEALDAVEALRHHYRPQEIRAAIAHDEIVDPRDFPRYRVLDVIPVLSFQWEKAFAAPATSGSASSIGSPQSHGAHPTPAAPS